MSSSSTKKRILKTASSLIAQKGYLGVSMNEIAQNANISKATLYYYFKSKEELCLNILRSTFEELGQELAVAVQEGQTPSDKLFNLIVAYVTFALKRPEVRFILQEEKFLVPPKSQLEKLVKTLQNQLLCLCQQVVHEANRHRVQPFAAFHTFVSLISHFYSLFIKKLTTFKKLIN
jgi:AcrR family transcriptional regulator